MLMEFQVKRFDYYAISRFSYTLINNLEIQPSMIPEVEQSIRNLELPERPFFSSSEL